MTTTTTAAPAAGRWTPLHWAGWVCAVLCTGGVALLGSIMIRWGGSTTCHQPASSAVRVHGQEHLALLAVGVSLGWVVAVLVSRHRLRMLLGWALGVSIVVYVVLTTTSTNDWVGSFCF